LYASVIAFQVSIQRFAETKNRTLSTFHPKLKLLKIAGFNGSLCIVLFKFA